MKITLLSCLILFGCGDEHLDNRENINIPPAADSVASTPSPDGEECVDGEKNSIKPTMPLDNSQVFECQNGFR